MQQGLHCIAELNAHGRGTTSSWRWWGTSGTSMFSKCNQSPCQTRPTPPRCQQYLTTCLLYNRPCILTVTACLQCHLRLPWQAASSLQRQPRPCCWQANQRGRLCCSCLPLLQLPSCHPPQTWCWCPPQTVAALACLLQTQRGLQGLRQHQR